MPQTSPASEIEIETAPAPPAVVARRAPLRYPALTRTLLRDTLRTAWRRVVDDFHAGGLYRLSLHGPLPERLPPPPDAIATPSLETANEIMRGRFLLPSGTLEVVDRSPFDVPAPDPLRADLHRFRWLADLEKAGGKAAHHVARALVEDWLDRYERPTPFAWRPEILGPRLVAWSAHAALLQPTDDLLFRSRFIRALAEQKRHLARTVRAAAPGLDALEAATSLIVMETLLPASLPARARAFEALHLAVEGAILPDGGIVTRSPRDLAAAVAALARAGRALADAQWPFPPCLIPNLDRMRGALALFLHADGRLACFNGAGEGSEAALADLTDGIDRPDASIFLPVSRYARLAGGGDTCVLFDCGGPPDGAHAGGSHAAPLAFELSHGEQRIVVNGGVSWRRGGDWIDAARRTGAHATIEIAEKDAGLFLTGSTARQLGARLYGGEAHGAMQASEIGVWAEGSHDLYRPRFGVMHRRRLFLSTAGDDLRGEDHLSRPARSGSLDIVARFPLHPDCRATLSQGGDSVLVAPPASEAWRFRVALTTPEQRLALEPAIYMGGETVRRTQAITIRATLTAGEAAIRWAFKLENPTNRTRRRLV